MTDCDWEWQRLRAESELKELEGDAFETRFQAIAKALWKTDFTATISMGSRGDLKCDGPGFLFHDSLKTVTQNIALLNSDEIARAERVSGVSFANYVLDTELSDTPDGGLFGLRFD